MTIKRKGFTLIEVLVSAILIGVIVTAIVASGGLFNRANAVGIDISSSEFLAEEIREMLMTLPMTDPATGKTTFGPEVGENSAMLYDDVDDFDGAVFSPPRDVNRQQLTKFAQFTQEITVENVSNSNFAVVVADHGSNFMRITVKIKMNGQVVNTAVWVRSVL